MKILELSQNFLTIVDDDIFEIFKDKKIHVAINSGKAYARFWCKKSNSIIFLHRYIMNPDKKQVIDHLNGNTLDNRRSNLKISNHGQNNQNKKSNKNTGSFFKGVHKNPKSWVSRIGFNNRTIYLGSFKTELEAAKAYDVAAIKYFGPLAHLNFPI